MPEAIAASGLTPKWEDISGMVEALVHTEGRKYPIPGMDHEDIGQEIRMECFRVLEYFDATRIGPSPYKYLETCVRNLIYNMRRGVWVPNNPPCARCPLWDRARRTCMIDEVDCEKIERYRINMAIKADLKRPATLEIDVYASGGGNECDAVILDHSIREILPSHLEQHYDDLIEGRRVPSRIKSQIRAIVKEIVRHA